MKSFVILILCLTQLLMPVVFHLEIDLRLQAQEKSEQSRVESSMSNHRPADVDAATIASANASARHAAGPPGSQHGSAAGPDPAAPPGHAPGGMSGAPTEPPGLRVDISTPDGARGTQRRARTTPPRRRDSSRSPRDHPTQDSPAPRGARVGGVNFSVPDSPLWHTDMPGPMSTH